jgi:hypothetical protein
MGNLFSNTVYVKIFSDRIELRQIESGRSETVYSRIPFTTNRLLVGQFDVAEETLKNGLNRIAKKYWLAAKPIMVIRPWSSFRQASQIGGRHPLASGTLSCAAPSAGGRWSVGASAGGVARRGRLCLRRRPAKRCARVSVRKRWPSPGKALVRRAKRGASGRVKVPGWEGR